MHYGVVHGGLEASIPLDLAAPDGSRVEVDFAIDTGFAEEMTLPPDIIDQFNLPTFRQLTLTMADGAAYDGDTYVGSQRWHSRVREIEVISVDGDPLIGMRLLSGSNLSIDAEPGGAVTVSELAAR